MLGRMVFAASVALVSTNLAVAWDGTNTVTGSSVEIERGQLVRWGRTIEVYDSTEGYNCTTSIAFAATVGQSRSKQQILQRVKARRLRWMAIKHPPVSHKRYGPLHHARPPWAHGPTATSAAFLKSAFFCSRSLMRDRNWP